MLKSSKTMQVLINSTLFFTVLFMINSRCTIYINKDMIYKQKNKNVLYKNNRCTIYMNKDM